MNPATAAYWEDRYSRNELQWDTGGITTPLKTYFDNLAPPLRVLIPGAGNSYEAEYLVNKGFKEVVVCDIAAQPLRNLQARCPAFPQTQLWHADFFELKLPATERFDLVIEQTFFCAIQPNMRSAYFQKVHDLLNPGGRLVGLLFNDKLNDDRPPFGGNSHEYRSYFESLFHIKTYETCYNSIPPRRGRELFINLEKPFNAVDNEPA